MNNTDPDQADFRVDTIDLRYTYVSYNRETLAEVALLKGASASGSVLRNGVRFTFDTDLTPDECQHLDTILASLRERIPGALGS